jgi:hypothetical protein
MKATTKSERSASISEENAAAENQESSSSFRSLLNEMGEYQRESLSKILDTTVDGSCLPSCEHGFEEQLDVLMVRSMQKWQSSLCFTTIYNLKKTSKPIVFYSCFIFNIAL